MGGYVLYGGRQTGSIAVEATLALMGVEHERIEVRREAGEHLTEAFTAINPRQQVPVLVLPDGTVVTEGPAILAHLADSRPEAGLAHPPGSSARALQDRWTAFLHANVYEAMLREVMSERYTDDPDGAEGVQRAATDYVRRHFAIIEAEIGEGPFLFGAQMTMADVFLWMLTYWVDPDWLEAACPKVARLRDAGTALPPMAEVLARHFGEGDD
jgi:glutathione S-transferase